MPQISAGPLNRFFSAPDSVPSSAGERQRREVVGARDVDAHVRGGELALDLADVGAALEQVRRQVGGNRRHADRARGLRVVREHRREDLARRAAEQRRERRSRARRPRGASSRCRPARPRARLRSMREVVVADDAGLVAVALQRRPSASRLSSVSFSSASCASVASSWKYVRAISAVTIVWTVSRAYAAREQVLARRVRRRAVLAPQVELVRRVRARCGSRSRSSWSGTAAGCRRPR